MNQRQKAKEIIEAIREGQMMDGRYPSDFAIGHGKIYEADLDPGKEYRAPMLIITPIKQFIEERARVLEEDE